MPNIKEIVLKAGLANFDNYQDDGKTLMVAGFDVTDQVIRTVEIAVAELAKGNEPVVIEEPDYYYEAMGCGLEDRNITDRYEAMKHGWDYAVFRFFEQIPDGPIYTLPPTASQIEQETAEACAKACEDVIGNTPHDQRMLAAIDCAVMLRSGAWKEFKK